MDWTAESTYQPSLSAQGEKALRVSDAIISISADAIISTDEQQRIIRFNKGAEEIFGFATEEVLGQPLEILLPERFRATHRQHVERFRESLVPARRMGERRPISGLRKNGQEFPAEASISKTLLDDQLIYTVVLRDVSDRLRTERGQRFLAQAGALFAGSLDADRTLENIATLAVPMLGDWCLILLGGDDAPLSRAIVVQADAESGEMRALHSPARLDPPFMALLLEGKSILRPDIEPTQFRELMQASWLNELQPRSLLAVPLQARGHINGAIAFVFDQSSSRVHDEFDLDIAEELARRAALALDNARLYEEAQAAIRTRDDVLAVVSHDLGNPLSAIRIGATVLLKQLPTDARYESAHKQVENIRSSVLQMERLIRDLLQVKQIEAGYLTLEKEKVSVKSLLGEAVEMLAPLAAAKEQTLRQVIDSDHAYIHADRERLLQVLSNLVGNAVKFTPESGQVIIGAETHEESVLFWVTDTGPGIPEEHVAHVFDRFWQARRTGRHGIGLGLAIVKGIVEAHKGKVWVESEIGQGSTFRFALPKAAADSTASE
jgi:PAS domain S-box-containing protein